MRKNILKMATVLVVAFALGALVGVSTPTEVIAADDPCPCLGLNQCWKWIPGDAQCPVGYQQKWSMTDICGECCGILLQQCCGPCP